MGRKKGGGAHGKALSGEDKHALDMYRANVDGHKLDLSMQSISRVSVPALERLSSISASPEASSVALVTAVDLSLNAQLGALPEDFGRLRLLVRLDVSRCALEKLPESFGQLESLRYLDLVHNKLR